MLKGLSSSVSPERLATLCRMGRGDATILDAPLFELGAYVPEPVIAMAAVAGDTPDPSMEAACARAVRRHVSAASNPGRIDRYALYDLARSTFVAVITGEAAKFDNALPYKGISRS